MTVNQRFLTTLTLLLLLLAPASFTLQITSGPTILRSDVAGIPTWMSGNLGSANASLIESSTAAMLPSLASQHLSATGSETFVHLKTSTDSAGKTHLRYQQQLDGLDVHGAMLNVHTDGSGQIYAINGRFVPDTGISSSPNLSANKAVAQALKLGRGKAINLLDSPALVFYLDSKASLPQLAWTVAVTIGQPSGSARIYASAVDGSLLERRPLTAEASNRKTYNSDDINVQPGELKLCECIYSGCVDGDTAVCATGGDPNAASEHANFVHSHLDRTYTYYQQVHGRDSYDGLGSTLVATVFDPSVNYANAEWLQSNSFRFGDFDGPGPIQPFGYAFDVVMHESQHAITNNEGLNLRTNCSGTQGPFRDESGAAHEAYGDMMSAAGEAWNPDSPLDHRWYQLGEVVGPLSPTDPCPGIRCIDDPESNGSGVDHYSEYSCSKTIHDKSGILTHAFYLMVAGGTHASNSSGTVVQPLAANESASLTKAGELAYNSLAFLYSSSDFLDIRFGFTQAAVDLYGVNSTEVDTVIEAFRAVGIGEDAQAPSLRFRAFGNDIPEEGNVIFPSLTPNQLPFNTDFEICNDGLGDLTIDDADEIIFPTPQSEFTQLTTPASTIAHGNCESFTVQFTTDRPDELHERTGAIFSNDLIPNGEGRYRFYMKAQVNTNVDIGLVANYVPSLGAARTETVSNLPETPPPFEFYFDQNLGSFEEQSGRACHTGEPANPTMMTVRMDSNQAIDGCRFRGSWDPAGQEFACSPAVIQIMNNGGTIELNTDSYLLDGSPVCDYKQPLEPHVPYNVVNYFKVTFIINGMEYVRQLDFIKNSQLLILDPVADTFISEGAPNQNFGTSPDLAVRHVGVGDTRLSALKFYQTATGTLASAQLRLTTGAVGMSESGIFANCSNSWQETNVTWNNHQTLLLPGCQLLSTDTSIPANATRKVDVTSVINGPGYNTFGIGTLDTDLGQLYRSREASSRGPKLVLNIQR